ncbi:NAD(P)-dependent oxidoreductase [Paracandidimonas soli]|uniref:3-hydroxyisobutyrate dehydrogenase-like beta-hydroxyacid dehydrogenase n=1 Tax=Paracandidimonas soli TaxID=1917182 RepID=A0A4R3VCT4_9BURK|nr:3-hydroxyisobutyrate dehydrogenase-like beta-hydroxyacid dehydrogenase [Paracandidimonas soli]
MSAKQVALYGLGNMGYLVAERIARKFPVQVADLNKQAVERARKEFDARPVSTPEDLEQTSVVVLCLPSPAASQAVLTQIAPHLPRNAVVVETSTVNPSDIHASARILDKFGIPLIDASIMAGVSQMAAGTAMLLVGGDKGALDACDDVLAAISDKRIHFGPAGSGAAAKVINNAVAHAVMVVVAEAGSMATAAGVDCEKLVGLLADKQMGLHRPLTHRYAERIMQGNYEGGMPLEAARKDSVLALELAQSLKVPLFAIQGAHSVYEMALAAGYGRDDYAAVAKIWNDWGCPAVPAKAAGRA